jgi:NTP pyrophosphatase (non-canonical NTP hydrolase)
MGPQEIREHIEDQEGKERVREEIADVLIYALLFCERVGIDPLRAI